MTDRSLPFSFAMEERDFRGARTVTQLCGSPAQGRVRFLAGWGIRFFRFPRSFPGCGLREKEWRKGAPLPLSRSSLPLPLPRWVRGWRKPARGSPCGTASHEEFAVTPRSRSFDFFSAFPAEPPPFRRCNIFFRFRRKGSYCSVDARRSPAGRIDCRPALFSPPHRKRRGGGDAAASTQRSGLRSGCYVACAACSPGYLAPGWSSIPYFVFRSFP